MSANREILDRYGERHSVGEIDTVMDHYAEDAVEGYGSRLELGSHRARVRARERRPAALAGLLTLSSRARVRAR